MQITLKTLAFPRSRRYLPCSEPKLGAAPVPALRVVPDGVVGPHADPVGNGAVLAHLLRQLLLDPEGLVGRHRCGGGGGDWWEAAEKVLGLVGANSRAREQAPMGMGSRRSDPPVQPPPPRMPPPPPAPAPALKLTADDALLFLRAVKDSLLDQREKYDEFIEIMCEFKSGRMDKDAVVSRVKVLFDGYPQLILGFKAFLPRGYQIKFNEEKKQPQEKKSA